MKTIQTMELGKLRQEEAFGFYQLADKVFAQCQDSKFTPVYATYADYLKKFDDALKPVGASAFTQNITRLDYERDAAYHGITKQISNRLRHFNANKVKAAQTLEIIFRKYGDPTDLPYIQENGVLTQLLQELEQPAAVQALATIDATDWAAELKRVHAGFLEHFHERTNEQAGIVTGISKEARKAMDKAYLACITRLNALAEIQGDAAFAPWIGAVNELIDYQKATFAARTTHLQQVAAASGAK